MRIRELYRPVRYIAAIGFSIPMLSTNKETGMIELLQIKEGTMVYSTV